MVPEDVQSGFGQTLKCTACADKKLDHSKDIASHICLRAQWKSVLVAYTRRTILHEMGKNNRRLRRFSKNSNAYKVLQKQRGRGILVDLHMWNKASAPQRVISGVSSKPHGTSLRTGCR